MATGGLMIEPGATLYDAAATLKAQVRADGRAAHRQDDDGIDLDDLARVTISTELEPGQVLRVVKLLGYGWSSRRSMPALRDQVDAILESVRADDAMQQLGLQFRCERGEATNPLRDATQERVPLAFRVRQRL